MKKTVLIVMAFLLFVSVQAQKQNKNAKVTIEVDGVCMMCKKRIETAALKTKGVKFAVWDLKTHQLQMIIDARKIDVTSIQKNIASVGHDTKAVKATDAAYDTVHACCRYRDSDVMKDDGGQDD